MYPSYSPTLNLRPTSVRSSGQPPPLRVRHDPVAPTGEQRPPARVLRGRERLRDLAVVAVDRDRLHAELPRLDEQLRDLVDRRLLGQVDRLRDRARDERLHRAHHLHVPHVVDRALADRAVEHGVVLGLQVRRADDAAALVDERDDLLDLARRVAELAERHRHRLVDDRDLAAADELLRLDEREVGLHAGRVAIHHEADRPGRREHGRLRVPEAVHLADLERVVPGAPGAVEQVVGHRVGVLDVADRGAVLRDHADHRRAVLLVAGVRAHPLRDLGRLAVRAARHQRRDRRRVRAALVRVVRQPARHQQRAEVRVAEAELAEASSRSGRSPASGRRSSRRRSPARGRRRRPRARASRRRARRPPCGTS